jgi:DNA-binding YbaB/EbfC family protein
MPSMGGAGLGELQAKIAQMQESLAQESVTATAGGGVVTVVMNGQQRMQSVTIAPEVLTSSVDESACQVNLDDIEMLQDLIVAAVNEALDKSQTLAAEKFSALTGGLRLPGLM